MAASSVRGIPTSALGAYRRAETVINAADESCELPWELVAAIGRVVSDHGRYGDSALGADGVARPAIYGVAMDGRAGIAVIGDTDVGQWDGDKVHDRAVGPMQFIPSTWSTVGLDADGDHKRNPQDIDDAALGAAVFLCGGTDLLSTVSGRRAALYRYNASQSYVDLVLAVMRFYHAGDYSEVPDQVTSAVMFTLDPVHPSQASGRSRDAKDSPDGPDGGGGHKPPASNVQAVPPRAPGPASSDSGRDDAALAVLQQNLKDTLSETVGVATTLLSPVKAALRCVTPGHSVLLGLADLQVCARGDAH